SVILYFVLCCALDFTPLFFFFFFIIPPPPISTLFPYTTLFRSIIISCCTFSFLICMHIIHSSWHLFIACSSVSFCITKHLDLVRDRKSTRLNSSHSQISYAVFCLKKKKKRNKKSYTISM